MDPGVNKIIPYAINNTSQTAYYKPEATREGRSNSKVEGALSYPIAPHKAIYSPVYGVNSTLLDPQRVYKVPNGSQVLINPDGVNIVYYPERILSIFNAAGEIGAPDQHWNSLRDSFNHLPSRR